jgi:cysteine desulfurase / selenocysteine lyase
VGYHSVDKSEDHMDYELKFRPGAARFEEALVNFPGIWGLDAAVQTLLELGMGRVEEYIADLRRQAREGLEARGYEIVSPTGPGSESGILSFRHPSIAADEIYRRLADKNVNLAIRAGSLRMSPSFYNDGGEIEAFLAALP